MLTITFIDTTEFFIRLCQQLNLSGIFCHGYEITIFHIEGISIFSRCGIIYNVPNWNIVFASISKMHGYRFNMPLYMGITQSQKLWQRIRKIWLLLMDDIWWKVRQLRIVYFG